MSVDLSGLRSEIRRHARALVETAAAEVAEVATAAAPIRTGELRASRLGPDVVDDTDQRIVARVSFHAPQAGWTDEGTRGPYVIRAKNAKVLRFIGRDGEVVFRRFVTHPGIRAQHWFAQPMQGRWDEALARAAG